MQGKQHHFIATEGWSILLVLALLAVASNVYLGLFASLLVVILLLVACVIFRNPRRVIPAAPLAVVSPASGNIQIIDNVDDPWLSRPALRFRLHMSLWDVHNLRCPVEGKVMNQWSSENSEPGFNKRYTYWIRTDEGDDVVFSLLMGQWSPFARLGLQTGERVGQGQPCGFLYFTGAIEVLMPANSRVEKQAGDIVDAGAAILGQFVHESGATMMGK